MTFNQFAEHAKRIAVMQGRQFTHPDDDWTITVLVEHPGDQRPFVIHVPGWVSNDGDAKEVLGWALGQAARATKPTKVALIQSAWVVDRELTGRPYDPEHEPMPRDHPDRIERLVLTVFDPEIAVMHWADIHRRRRRPPVLGPWAAAPRDGFVSGRMATPLIDALR